MAAVLLPDPSLVALVGAAGSGKSTFAARHFTRDEILSSDELRRAIVGDARDQRATRPAFAALHRSLARRLGAGLLTVVDATSVERHARIALVRRAVAAGVPAVAVVLDLPADVVLARNAARAESRVDPEVVARHLAVLTGVLERGSIALEGWTQVVRLRDARVIDELVVRRVRAAKVSR